MNYEYERSKTNSITKPLKSFVSGALVLFSSVILSSSVSAAGAYDSSFKDCLLNSGSVTPESLTECRRSYRNNTLQIIEQNRAPLSPSHSYTLSLGLNEPVFSGLKRMRDDFIQKYINTPIAEIEDIRDKNIQTFNLKTIYGETGTRLNNSILSSLESAFGLNSLESTFKEFIDERKAKCKAQYESKMSSCGNMSDVYDKAQCTAEATDIQNNCFKYSTKNSKLNIIQNKLAEWEDSILDEIAKISLVKQDSVQNLYRITKSKLTQIDDTVNAINESASTDFSGRLGNYLNAEDPISIIERKVGTRLGLGEALVGAGAFTKTNTKDLINVRSDSRGNLNNLCDLTSCLVYPDSRKWSDKSRGIYSADYQAKCVNKGLTENELNAKINEIRRELAVIVGKLVLSKVLTEVPIYEYMNTLKRSVMCSAHATMSALQNDFASFTGGGCTTCASAASTLGTSMASVSKTAEKATKCLSKQFDQASSTIGGEVQAGLGKVSGWLTGALQSIGFITVSENVPFATPSFGAKVGMEKIATDQITGAAALQQCIKEGETETWVANYNRCLKDDMAFNLNFEFNFKMPELMTALRKSTQLQCKASLNPIPVTTTITFDKLYQNPDVTPASYQNDHTRWVRLDSLMKSALQNLNRMKISPKLFFETKEAVCATNALDVITNQSGTANSVNCAILDIPNAPVIDWSKTVLDNFGEENQTGLPNTLVPSVKKLCEDSAVVVNEHFSLMSPFTPQQLESIRKDKESIYNVSNSILKPNTPENTKYRITRAISNIGYCSDFFTNLGYERIFKEQDITKYENENSYLTRLDLKQGNISYNEYKAQKVQNRQYQETLAMLSKRTETERYNLCIKHSEYRQTDYYDRKGIKQAVFDFCKTYKINKFDKYFTDALTDFDFPLSESNEEAVKRIQKVKDIRNKEYRGEGL